MKKIKQPSIVGSKNDLNWLMVAAFRYSVDRHHTQAMYGIDRVLIDNIDTIETVFLHQFVHDIQHQQDIEQMHKEWKLSADDDLFFGLKNQINDALRLIKDVSDEKVQKLYLHLNQLLTLLELVDQDVIANREYIYKPWVCDTSYLMPLLKGLKQELDKRGEE